MILMNPPFKGAVDKNDLHESLQAAGTSKTELLFVHLILRALDMGGRGAVIVPDGVLFGSSKAHVALRKRLIEENRLEGVVSMPSGVFRPYAGVSTAALFFTRGAKTEDIWFYDMAHDGFSLDDKRLPVAENDIPDVLLCWNNRQEPAFREGRQQRLAELKAQAAPLKSERLGLLGEINRLTFEQALTPDPSPEGERGELEAAQGRLAELEAGITPLQREIDQLSRQYEPHQKAVDLLMLLHRKHIAPVDRVMEELYRTTNANVHRGVHYLSDRVSERYEAARETVRAFINARSREEIIFSGSITV